MEQRLHPGSRYILTTVWATRSATVGTPSDPHASLPSSVSPPTRTGGGKYVPDDSRFHSL